MYLTIYYNHFGVELQQTLHKYSEKQCCWREKYVWIVGSRCYGVILCEKETDGCKKVLDVSLFAIYVSKMCVTFGVIPSLTIVGL